MEDFRKKTDEELHNIKNRKPVPNIITHEVDIEIQRRFQEANLQQISSLVEEIKKLKNITDENGKISMQNAQSDSRLSRVAICIAVATLFTQIVFSTHQERTCDIHVSTDDPSFVHYTNCYRIFDLGLLGTHSFRLSDFKKPQ
jgi:hypothetical protein